jgi:hypothetical protein
MVTLNTTEAGSLAQCPTGTEAEDLNIPSCFHQLGFAITMMGHHPCY